MKLTEDSPGVVACLYEDRVLVYEETHDEEYALTLEIQEGNGDAVYACLTEESVRHLRSVLGHWLERGQG